MGFRVILQNLSDQPTGPCGYARTSIPWEDDATRNVPMSAVGVTADGRAMRGRLGPVVAPNFVFGRPGAPCFRELEIRGIDLQSFEHCEVQFELGEATFPPSVDGDDVEQVPGVAAMQAPGDADPIPAITFDANGFSAKPDTWRTLRESLGGVSLEASCKLLDCFHAKWTFRIRPGFPIVEASLRIIHNSQAGGQLFERLPAFKIETGVVPWFDFAVERGGEEPECGYGGWSQKLQGDTMLRKGQQLVFRGAFLLDGAARTEHFQAWANRCGGGVAAIPHPDEVQDIWPVFGSWGSYEGLETQASARSLFGKFGEALRAHANDPTSTALSRPRLLLTCDRKPGQTGEQPDFGVATVSPCLGVEGGNPSWLRIAMFSQMWDMQRPSHWLEPDGSMLVADAHPEVCLWDGDVHYSDKVSEERIGVPAWRAGPGGGGLHGYDLQHWSRNTLHALYILTGGDELCESEIRHDIENWLLTRRVQETTEYGNKWPESIGGAESIRGARAEQAMALAFACTGDMRIPQRMAARAPKAYARALADADAGRHVFAADHREDGRLLLHKRAVAIWESSMGILGYVPQIDLIAMVDGELAERWRKLVRGMCKTWVERGFVKQGGRWKLLKAITEEAIRDVTFDPASAAPIAPSDPGARHRVEESHDYDHWVPAALELCAELCKEHGLTRQVYAYFQGLRRNDPDLLSKAVRWQHS